LAFPLLLRLPLPLLDAPFDPLWIATDTTFDMPHHLPSDMPTGTSASSETVPDSNELRQEPQAVAPSEASVATSAPLEVATRDEAGAADNKAGAPAAKAERGKSALPVLETLFELYPQLFGANFLPLKLGVFQELLARHPDRFVRDQLKVALGVHTRSTRYLQCVAAGKPRHDLDGAAIEPVAPEHVFMALLELFRRRQGRSREDLRPKLRGQIISAFEGSGLSRQDYLACIRSNDIDAMTLLDEAFAERDQKLARQEALLKTFDSSGKTPAEFADMYGLDKRDLMRALDQRRAAAEQAAT
jgi:ProP effector